MGRTTNKMARTLRRRRENPRTAKLLFRSEMAVIVHLQGHSGGPVRRKQKSWLREGLHLFDGGVRRNFAEEEGHEE